MCCCMFVRRFCRRCRRRAAARRDTPHTTLHVHAYRNGAKLVVFSHYISYNSEITGKNLPFEVKEVSHRLH